jgi:hypothetical protein
MDMGDAGVKTLERVVGCTRGEAFALLSGRGVWQAIVNRPRKRVPTQSGDEARRRRIRLVSGHFAEAADGTRTHDLLHGKQTL